MLPANLYKPRVLITQPRTSIATAKSRPESLGTIASVVYLMTMFMYMPVFFEWVDFKSGKFQHEQFVQYLCALLSISCMIFLGFADDVLNLKWRHKIIIPTVATLPLLMVYIIGDGT